MTSTAKPRNFIARERAEVIEKSALYASGEWFTAQEMARELGIGYRKILSSFGLLRKASKIESRIIRGKDGQQWRKCEPKVNPLCVAWRKRTNEQLGIS